MDYNDDSLTESGDSESDQEADESSEWSSHQVPNNRILILSSESLSSGEGTTYVLPPELDLGSLNTLNKSGLSVANLQTGKGKPVVIKAQSASSSPAQYILLPESATFPTVEEQNGVQVKTVFYGRDERRKSKQRVRERNVTPAEKGALIRIWKKYPEIDVKDCNNEVNHRKRKAWEYIHKEFTAVCPDPESKDRSIKFLQGCWKRFKKEMRKRGRTTGSLSEEEEAVSYFVHSTPPPAETESQPDDISSCLSLERTASSGIQNGESHLNGKKTVNSKPNEPCPGGLPVNGTSCQISLDSSADRSAVSGRVCSVLSGDSCNAPRNADSDGSGEKTKFSRAVGCRLKEQISRSFKEQISKTAADSAMRDSRSHSVIRTRPLSARCLRRRALELAVEVEEEKLAASRYRREAEQERLAAMKLQRSAQSYALMVEKERYETELLKKEAARMSLERLS